MDDFALAADLEQHAPLILPEPNSGRYDPP